jgi:hypothetical protein
MEPRRDEPLKSDEPSRSDEARSSEQAMSEPVQHVAGAHHLLKSLSEKFGEMKRYPELEEAISKLELALNQLTVNTGGMF